MYREIALAEPHLPDLPSRRENISDEEVREIQRVAREVYPDFIVVISGVTEGCACEEGAHCAAQVELVLNLNNTSRNLVLSKVDNHWKLGAAQSWWLRWEEFQRDHPQPAAWDAYRAWIRSRQAVLEQFPACPVPYGDWKLLRSGKSGSTFIDMSSLQVSGLIRRVNEKRAYTPPASRTYPPWTKFSISRVAYDCKDHRERIDRQMTYSSDGTVQRLRVEDPVLWWPIKQESVWEKDWDLVCNWKPSEPH